MISETQIGFASDTGQYLSSEHTDLTINFLSFGVQADTYRRMKKATKNQWQSHCPITNCLWMAYTADIILNLKPFPMSAQQKKLVRGFRYRVMQLQACPAQHAALPCNFDHVNACVSYDSNGEATMTENAVPRSPRSSNSYAAPVPSICTHI